MNRDGMDIDGTDIDAMNIGKVDIDGADLLEDKLPRILPPSDNGVFQAVLTLPEAHAALVNLVSSILDRGIKTVTLRNNSAPSRDIEAKQEEYDVSCVVDGEDGDQCGLEMQTSPMSGDNRANDHRNIKLRSVLYLCDLHANQRGRGLRYGQLVRSYQVMLCNYNVFGDAKHELVRRYTLRDRKGQELCDAVTAIFIDLTQAKEIAKKPVNEMSNIELWVVFFALAHKPEYSELIAELTKHWEGIAVAYDTLVNISQNPDERARFLSRRKWLETREHERLTWKDEGLAEGRAEGRAEGIEIGILNTARNAIKQGVDVDTIIRFTGLAREEIEALSKA
jgi:predicted transposase/invertase (TIGR01784 family)